ncbi:hypothetical protein HN840_04290, partial [archaeon]|nr:hypothetical protein [archaeon]
YLNISNNLTVDGYISVNATSITGNGAGAGGSIYLRTGILSGSGNISAVGGRATSVGDGSGAGGRIAIYYDTYNFVGGINANAQKAAYDYDQGGAGTIYLKDSSKGYGNLTINNIGLTGPIRTLLNDSLLDTSTLDNLNIYGGSSVIIDMNLSVLDDILNIDSLAVLNQTVMFTMDNISNLTLNGTLILGNHSFNKSMDVHMLSGSVLSHKRNNDSQLYMINISARNFTIDNNAFIEVKDLGYSSGYGPGVPSTADYGGGHGGSGSKREGIPYGSLTSPLESGSGAQGFTGGFGAGVIHLNISDTLTINGFIGANASKETSDGAGAGGSIYLITNKLEGSGNITARGGAIGTVGDGSGAGGRIALYYETDIFSGEIDVSGALNSWLNYNGNNGSIFRCQYTESIFCRGDGGSDVLITNGSLEQRTFYSKNDSVNINKTFSGSWTNETINWTDSSNNVSVVTTNNISGLYSNLDYFVFANNVSVETITSDGSGTLSGFDTTLSTSPQILGVRAKTNPTINSVEINTTVIQGYFVHLIANVTDINLVAVNFSVITKDGSVFVNQTGTQSGDIWNSTAFNLSETNEYNYTVDAYDSSGNIVSSTGSINTITMGLEFNVSQANVNDNVLVYGYANLTNGNPFISRGFDLFIDDAYQTPSDWWNYSWPYRTNVSVGTGYAPRGNNSVVKVVLNFTAIMDAARISGTLDSNSIRVADINKIELDAEVVNWLTENSTGMVRWKLTENGTIAKETNYTYYVYYDIIENGLKDIPNYDLPKEFFLCSGADNSNDFEFAYSNYNRTLPTNWTTWVPQVASDDHDEATIFDMDNDGDLDIASVSDDLDTLYIFHNDNNDNWNFTQIEAFAELGANNWFGLCEGDFNEDGWADIVTNGDNCVLRYYQNDQDGTFTYTSSPGDCGTGENRKVACADLNGDNDLDLIAGEYLGTGCLNYFRGHGNGSFTDDGCISDSGSFADDWHGIWVVDNDNDGDLDIYGQSAATYVTYFENNGTGISANGVNMPDGGLLDSAPIQDLWSSGSYGDYDNDGVMDLAEGSWTAATSYMGVYWGNNTNSSDIFNGGLPGDSDFVSGMVDYMMFCGGADAIQDITFTLENVSSLIPYANDSGYYNYSLIAPASGGNYVIKVNKSESSAYGETSLSLEILAFPANPVVSLNSPSDTNYSVVLEDILFNCSVTDENNNLVNITLYHNLNGSWTANGTVDISGGTNETVFVRNISDFYNSLDVRDSVFNWTCVAYDNESRVDWGNTNNSFGSWDLGTYDKIILNNSENYLSLDYDDDKQELNSTWFNTTGLVLLMHMNEASGAIVDSSGMGNNGTDTGGVTYSSEGKLNTAIDFGGASYVSIPHNEVMDITDTITLSAWINLDTTGTWEGIVGKGVNTGQYALQLERNTGNKLQFTSDYSASEYTFGNQILGTNKWYYVVATFDNGVVSLYVDGVLDARETVAWTIESVDEATAIGMDPPGSDEYLDGTIDEVAVWNRSLSEIEIANIYDMQKGFFVYNGSYTSRVFDVGSDVTWNNITWDENYPYGELPNNQEVETVTNGINMTGNILLMHMNEVSGVVADSSGMGNDGTDNGGIIYDSEGILQTAIDLDGVDDYIEVNLTMPDDGTVAFWYFAEDWYNTQGLYDNSVSQDDWEMWIDSNGLLRARIDSAGTIVDYDLDSLDGPNHWYHIVLTWEKTGNKILYVNSILRETQAVTWQYPGGNITIGGGYVGNTNANGTMDEFAIWNRTFSAEEITNLYRRSVSRLNVSARSCDDNVCDTETWNAFGSDASFENISSLSDSRYLQYKLIYESENTSYSPELNWNSVVVSYASLNAIPTIINISLDSTSSANFTNGTLQTYYEFSDADSSDTQVLNETQWWKDGVLQTNLINFTYVTSMNTSVGQWWNFSVRVYDGTVWSEWSQNVSLKVVNHIPEIISLELNSSSLTNSSAENLTANVVVNDLNEDTVRVVYDWRKSDISNALVNMPFEFSSNKSKDYSSYGHNGSVANVTWSATGGYDGSGAYEFNDSNNYINLGNGSNYIFENEITISLWVKPTSFSDWSFYAGRGLNSCGPPWVGVYLGTWQAPNTQKPRWALDIDNTLVQTNNGVDFDMTAGNWYHLVGTYNGTAIKLYGNGEELAYNNASGNLSNLDTYFGIGKEIQGCKTEFLNGSIDEVLILNKSISGEQVRALYQNKTNVMVSQETSVNDNWSVQVTINDGTDESEANLSNYLFILNSAPTVSNIVLNSSSLSNLSNGTLNSYYSYVDPEGGAQILNETQWWKDGVLQTDLINFTSLNSGNTSSEEWWNFSVRAFDGTDWSAWSENVSLYIRNARPVGPNILSPLTGIEVRGSTYNISWTAATDIDTGDNRYYNLSLYNVDRSFNQSIATNLAMTQVNYTWNTTGLTDGSYRMNISLTEIGPSSPFTNYAQDGIFNIFNADRSVDISIARPDNGTGIEIVNFVGVEANFTNNSQVTECQFIFNGSINQSTSIFDGDRVRFNLTKVDLGKYEWSINCSDADANYSSGLNTLVVIKKYPTWGGNSTNFSAFNLENITNLILDEPGFVKMNFSRSINLLNLYNLTACVNLSSNRIEVNSTLCPQFNVSSELSFVGVDYTDPQALKDGAPCNDTNGCNEVSYTGGEYIFNVSGFTVYSVRETPAVEEEESSSSTTTTATSGGGGGGGGGGGARTLAPELFEPTNFSLSEDSFTFDLAFEESKEEVLVITNDLGKEQDFDLSINNIGEVLTLSEYEFTLDSYETKEIVLHSVSDRDAGVHVGTLKIKSEFQTVDLPVVVEIASQLVLFDASLFIPSEFKELNSGETLETEITLFNVGSPRKVDVLLNYRILDLEGNTVLEESETIAVQEQMNFNKEFYLPSNMEMGTYVLGLEVIYVNSVAVSSSMFDIVGEEVLISSLGKGVLVLIIALILMILLIGIMLLLRRRNA